jgi:hypothetical protein
MRGATVLAVCSDVSAQCSIAWRLWSLHLDNQLQCANMLNAMSSALISAATKMVAQYVIIGIARMFAGMGGGPSKATSLDQLNMADILATAAAPATMEPAV